MSDARAILAWLLIGVVVQLAWTVYVVYDGSVPYADVKSDTRRQGNAWVAHWRGVRKYQIYSSDIPKIRAPISEADTVLVRDMLLHETRIVDVISYGWPYEWSYCIFPHNTAHYVGGYIQSDWGWSVLRDPTNLFAGTPRAPLAVPRVHSFRNLLVNSAMTGSLLACLYYPLQGALRAIRRRARRGPACMKCGYSRDGLCATPVCPECGAEWDNRRPDEITRAEVVPGRSDEKSREFHV